MTLLDGNISGNYVIVDTNINKNIQRRLKALGLTDGTKIQILNNKKSGSVIFKVRGTRLAVGKKIACGIEIKTMKSQFHQTERGILHYD
ncbi:ferrous iron transport protein A [Clostridium botulinum]|uniref:Ferrous iron transport protein A n=1 Tax=Clostridium botulinum TaxID=1491 RepID=A0A6B4ZH44_CLOBO|nr:ferrous iron transport protein A [Clostridium botulinum]NFD85900.1 ferrous iron transport protein A [Clostridium botulinum]NFE07265.1 ferrous iron transport protein A [Clostridium botulinum]NFE35446.1 ferrous iron transport protein A [Clostridium botulinum]NFE49709.1 ferrous iron transport protein A [Clostridium botulinum]